MTHPVSKHLHTFRLDSATGNDTRLCQEIKAHLSEYLDDALEQDMCAQVQAHLRECPECGVMVDTMRKTIVLYHDMEPEPMPDAARERLYHTLHLTEFLKPSGTIQ